jgi:hypothetical protein
MPSARRSWCRLPAVLAAVACVAATPIHDRDLKFRAVVPDGFEPNAEDAGDTDLLYSFVRPPKDGSGARTVVRIKRMRGLLPPDLPMAGFTREGQRFEVAPEPWGPHTLRRARTVMEVGGRRVVVLNVQVPLKPEAIAVVVGGGEADEADLLALLRGVLASVEGESNWSADGSGGEAAGAAKERDTRGAYCCVGVLAVVGVLIYSRWRGRGDRTGPPPSSVPPA